MKRIKSLGKEILGKSLVFVGKNPVAKASLAHVGYSFVPDYFYKSAYKAIDIRKIQPFGRLADEAIKTGRTCLYYDRLYIIFQALSNLVKSRDKLCAAEVGVYKGGTSYFISQLLSESNVKWKLYAIDTFEGHHVDDINPDADKFHKASNFSDTSYEDVKSLLRNFNNTHVIKGRFQDKCKIISKEKFQFAHLDMDIYEPTLYGLRFFEKHMDVGAVIVVDDYGFESCPGAKQAVDEFIAESNSFHMFHLLTGQALLIKIR